MSAEQAVTEQTEQASSPSLMGRALPAALQMLSRARSCCVLSVMASKGIATIAVADGKIVWATSSTTQRLGEKLVEKGFVTPEVLDNVLSIQKRKRKPHPLCTILCELEIISPEVARAEIEAQTVDVLFEVMSWDAGTIRVEPSDRDDTETIVPGTDVESLLVRVALLQKGFGDATREIRHDGTIAVQ